MDGESVLSAAASDLEDDQVMMQAAATLEAEVAGSISFEDEVVTLSEEYIAQFFVGDIVNLAALSKAVNVSHEFLAGYVFEHGLGQPVTEIKAAAAAIAFESDQLATQAVAAREEEVSVLEKLGALMQEMIEFFVKGVGATRVCRGHPSESLSLRSSCCLRVSMCAIMVSALMLDCLLRLLVSFLVAQFVSIRG